MFKKMFFCAGLFCSSFGAVQAQIISFEDLTLPTDSFWNGSDGSGGFTSGTFTYFPNNFVDYGGGFTAWDGFAYSNKVNDSTQAFGNMYSCFAGHQLSGSSIFTLSFNPMNYMDYSIIPTEVNFPVLALPQFMWVTNSTYTALTIENGDAFCKAFGGLTGDDPDWFRLNIVGSINSVVTDTIIFYLADYRFSDNQQDYIIKEWTNIDLTSLGYVDKLQFILNSSDTGSYGMNTPAFFCFDNLEPNFMVNIEQTHLNNSLLFPNPTYGKVNSKKTLSDIKVYSIDGKQVLSRTGNFKIFDLSGLKTGLYLIKMKSEGKEYFQKMVKE